MKKLIVLLLLTSAGMAKDAKVYPLFGRIMGMGTADTVPGRASGCLVRSVVHKVYALDTPTEALAIMECSSFGSGWLSPSIEPLVIGETVAFRTDGKFVYLLRKGKEQRYFIRGEEVKELPNPK
jgi:hypothetical protein